MSNEVVDNETVDGILTEFAKRDPVGYLVFGVKISRAYREEVKNRENESRAANDLVNALDTEVKRLTAENTKLRSLVGESADALECRLCDYACEIHGECPADMKKEDCESFKFRALVAKAREVTNG